MTSNIGLRIHRATALVAEAQHHGAEPTSYGVRDGFSVLKLTIVDEDGSELALDVFLAERNELGRKIADIYATALIEAATKAAALTAVAVETVGEAA